MYSVKLLDWGEEGHRSEAEIASLRAAFTQEVAVWHKLDHPNVTKVNVIVLHLLSPGHSFIPSQCKLEAETRNRIPLKAKIVDWKLVLIIAVCSSILSIFMQAKH